MNLVTFIVSLAIILVCRPTTELVVSLVDAQSQNVLTDETSILLRSTRATTNNNIYDHDYDHRKLQTDKRVKIFQEKNHIVVIEAESVDRRRFVVEDPSVDGKINFAESSAWKFENNVTQQTDESAAITDYRGSGYVRFSSKNMTNMTTAITPRTTSLTYYINITNPGDYSLSLRSYKESINLATSYCDVQMENYPGVLGTKVKAYAPGSSDVWRYRTLLQVNELNTEEIPIYSFPIRGTYRFVILGRMGISDYVLDRLMFYDNTVHTVKFAESINQSQSKFVLTKAPINAWPKLNPSPTLPLLPNFASTPQLPKYLFDTGIVNETLIYNETNMILSGKSKVYNFSQPEVLVLPEWQYPYSDVSSMFQTYRSGLNFAYEFSNLYPPGTLVNVTLGFLENYELYCNKTRGRVFNVTVNGKEYVSSLDVFGTVGCNVSLLLSKQFQINKSGKIVINFNSVKQNPMIALIGIDDGQTSSPIQVDSLSDVPSTVPSNVPSDVFSNVPSDTPSDVSSSSAVPTLTESDDAVVTTDSIDASTSDTSNIPSDVPSDAPSSVSSDTPSDEPSDVLSDVPSDTPSDNSSSNTPSEVPSDAPSSVSSDTPSDAPSDVSSDVPSNAPSDNSSNVPSNVPSIGSTSTDKGIIVDEGNVSVLPHSDQPSSASSDSPSDAPSDVSSATPSDIPSDNASNVPSNFLSVTPTADIGISSVPSDTPSDSPSDAPSDMPSAAPRPIVGLNLVVAETGVLVAAIKDGDIIERGTIGLTTNLTIVAETMDAVETVRFVYDGITQIEGVAPYAMYGKSFNGNKYWPVQYLSTNGLKMVTVDVYDITYTKSIDEVVVTFTIV